MLYSIWIIPPEPLYTELKKTVAELATAYNGPMFEPHLTLLGNIDEDLSVIEQKVKDLTINMKGLELSLGPVSYSTTFFQSVFVRVNSSAQLMQLNLDAKKVFGMENDVFMPHISLLYGDHDSATREAAAAQVQLPQASFAVNEFVITPATLNPNEWEHTATISW